LRLAVPKFQLVLLIHAHQPVGNFEDVFERSYRCCYLPFAEALEQHPTIHLGLHFSGPLLEWFERAHPEYFDQLRRLCRNGQVEVIGGGFYEPVLIAIPPQDRIEQAKRLADYIEKHFEARPRGGWLTERVWEPQIPSSLVPGGVEYTLVDDSHFLAAGFEPKQLYGYYTAEELCHTVKLLPGLKTLRYLIPFGDVSETTHFLWEASRAHPGGFAAMGDDLEKFGAWPGTHAHCYRNGWLENFFRALEECREWLEVVTPANAVATHRSLGRADLPTASYTEMMEWVLPTAARNRFHQLAQEFSNRPEDMSFLRGGVWRSFCSKYYESNLMHKKMLRVSEKVKKLRQAQPCDPAFAQAREEAARLLLSGQCNDAYWHGVFGGLYSPHLRTAVWRPLVQAEAIADGLEHENRNYAEAATFDFDADGRDEIYFTSNKYAALVAPDDGGTVCALDFRSSGATLINSLKRRPEAYHGAVKNLGGHHPLNLDSIDEQRRTREPGLDRWLKYDRWRRHAFRVLLFGQAKSYQDYGAVGLEENAELAGGPYRVSDVSSQQVKLRSGESADWPAEKMLSFGSTDDGFDLACELSLRRNASGTASVCVGLEVVVNFLAPSASDRYFETEGQRFPLRWSSALPARELRVVDEWQRVAVKFEAPGARDFWIMPIETVSESEDGFERIYQGSQIMAVWPIEIAPGTEWRGQMTLRVSRVGNTE
jgi:4-alpha-glucanotransferase